MSERAASVESDTLFASTTPTGLDVNRFANETSDGWCGTGQPNIPLELTLRDVAFGCRELFNGSSTDPASKAGGSGSSTLSLCAIRELLLEVWLILHFGGSAKMQMNTDRQRDIFDMLHDGSIVAVRRSKNNCSLQIEIPYLAQLVKDSFESFFIEMIDCAMFTLVQPDVDRPIDDIEVIQQKGLEILSCDDQENDFTKVYCQASFGAVGELHIKARNIKISDQQGNEISYDYLVYLCKEYWSAFGQKTTDSTGDTGTVGTG